MDHLAVRDPRRVVTGPKLLGLPNITILRIPDDGFLAATVEAFVLEENDGVVVLVRREQCIERILRRAWVERFDSRHRQEERLELLRMERSQRQPAATRKTQHERTGRAGAEMK